jgi:hypothetical protein
MSQVNPSINPLVLLRARADPNAEAPGGAPQSAAPPPARPPVADASSIVGGGGRPAPFSNIGTRLSNAMSGGGFLSDPNAVPDGEVDPVTGIPRVISQRANNQSMMKMGLLLMAAGQFQSDDSRARMLSAMPGIADNSDTVNTFARNRLEMAKVRMLERQQMAEAAQSAAFDQYIAGNTMGGAPIAASAPGAAVTGETAGMAGTPLAGTTPSAPTGLEAGTVPAPGPVQSAPMPPAMAPGDQGPPMPTPPAPSGGAALAPTPNAFPANVTPVGVASEANLPTSAPAPVMPRPQFTPQEAALAQTLPFDQKRKFMLDKETEWRSREMQSEPYMRPGVGVVVDVYKGGQKVGTQKIGDVGTQIVTRVRPDGATEYLTVGDDGRLAGVQVVRDPNADAEYQTANREELELIGADRNTLRTAFTDSVQPAERAVEKLTKIQENIEDGKTLTGTGADYRYQLMNMFASAGMVSDGTIEQLQNYRAGRAELEAVAGQVAKDFFGPQISDADRESAKMLVGAMMSDNPQILASTVGRIRQDKLGQIKAYGVNATAHNDMVGGVEGVRNKRLYQVPGLSRDWDQWEADRLERRAKTEPAASAPAIPDNGTADGLQWRLVD